MNFTSAVSQIIIVVNLADTNTSNDNTNQETEARV